MTNHRARIARNWITCGMLVVSSAVVSCIDVGEEAETGCLADMKLPGCHATGGTQSSGATSSGAGESGVGGAAGATQ